MDQPLSHREDIKAAIRKKFGSVFNFEDEMGLPRKSVSDRLRGRPNSNVDVAIKKTLPTLVITQSDKSGSSAEKRLTHRLNSQGK